jgi:hypothetical protein
VPSIVTPLKKAIRSSSWKGNIPALVHIDFNHTSEKGVYNWKVIKSLLKEKIGWVDTPEVCKGLHTSCTIEQGKEYSQLINFRNKTSSSIPFSALEIALAVSMGNLSRADALQELRSASGFKLEKPEEIHTMEKAFNNKA